MKQKNKTPRIPLKRFKPSFSQKKQDLILYPSKEKPRRKEYKYQPKKHYTKIKHLCF